MSLSSTSQAWPWMALFLLGAYHGINPGMGWLFAVALGMQEKSGRAVVRALGPLTLGHVLSVALVVMLLAIAAVNLSQRTLRLGAGAVLIAFGLYRLIRARHPRWVGMRVGARDLTVWSFLMASAHGAGLMLAPILLKMPASSEHAQHTALLASAGVAFGGAWFWPVAIHTLGYAAITGLVSWVVYRKLGVAVLRRAWFNLDLVWTCALVATGVLTLFW